MLVFTIAILCKTTAVTLHLPNSQSHLSNYQVFFPNAKEADFQFVTVPNFLIRIHPNGEILYILR